MDTSSTDLSRLKLTDSKTENKVVTSSLIFDESSNDDIGNLMTPSVKRKLDTPDNAFTSPAEEYESPCFQELFQSNGPRAKRFRSFESRKNLFHATVQNQFTSLQKDEEETKENHRDGTLHEQTNKTGGGHIPLITGDEQFPLCLPTISGNVHDLHNITPKTLHSVLQGKYADKIKTYRIIDCRYPYEYAGGHIKGAENIFTEEGILELLYQKRKHGENERHILIFHCEFSSERGPKKCRFLRNQDRQVNVKYPDLNHPEVYLLHGGYKAFYQTYKEFCEPPCYIPMLHKDHANDLRIFRKKSKSWTAGEKKQYALMNIQL